MKGLVLPLLLPLSVLATVPCPPDSAHAPETRRHQGIASVAGAPFDRQDETSLAGEPWAFVVESSEPVVRHGADALREFLAKRFAVDTTAAGGVRRIVLAVAPEKDPLTSRLTVTEREIRISGATPREVLQGCYRLEGELNLNARPAVKRGSRTYTRMFSPRMVHSGVSIDNYPDEHLDEIARAGMDAILVYVRDPPDVTRAGRVDMNDLVRRAAVRGLDVYAYFDRWNRHLKKHPLNPGAEDEYDRMFGSIVRNAPRLKGLVCVGESCGFPREDGTDAGFNIFAPVPDWAPWLALVSKVTRRYNPDFDIVFWTYSWPRAPEKDRLALLEAIPTNCSVLVTFELGEKPQKRHGVLLSVDDYSISIPGPSPAFLSEAPTVRRRGMRLVTMSNTAGRTWDFGGAPYEPVPFCWLKRFRALRETQRTQGVTALMDSHHYGFAPNFCANIAKLAFTREVTDAQLEACIDEEVKRQFGAADAPAVLAALRDWSAAMDWHSASSLDQWGVLRVGPTYPFVPMGAKLPPPPSCLGKGKKWKFVDPVAGQVWGYGYAPSDLPPHIELSKGELALWKSGTDRLADLTGEEARRLLGLGKFCECSIRTRYNLHRYWKAVADRRPAAEVRRILDEEAANVRELLPFVEADARLGWEPEMRFVASPACLRWKLGQLEEEKERIGK